MLFLRLHQAAEIYIVGSWCHRSLKPTTTNQKAETFKNLLTRTWVTTVFSVCLPPSPQTFQLSKEGPYWLHKESFQVRGRPCLFTRLNTNTHTNTLSSQASLSVCFAHRLHCILLISDSLSTLQFVGTYSFVDVITGVCECVGVWVWVRERKYDTFTSCWIFGLVFVIFLLFLYYSEVRCLC